MASTSAATSILKPLSNADSFLLSLPSPFTYRTPQSFLSFPSKFIPFPLSYSHSSPFSPSKKKTLLSSLVISVAQEDETITIDEGGVPNWGNQDLAEEEAEEEGEGSFVEPNEDAKLFVGNLPYDFDSQKLAMFFEKAGTVEIAEVIYNRETDQSRGFGFVTMSTVEEAEKAVDAFNRYDLSGRLLTVNKAAPRGSRPEREPRTFQSACRIYVGNLPWDVDNARLEQVFSEHGKVVDARVLYDRDSGRSRGFGFVTMADENGMNDAIAALDGQSIDGRAIRVNVAEEKPRRNF